MATIVVPPVVSTDTGFVFLLGGDTYNGDKTQRDFVPGMMDYDAENGLKNDGIGSLYFLLLSIMYNVFFVCVSVEHDRHCLVYEG